MVTTESQYKKLRDLVYRESGINLHEGKLELLKARLAKRMRITRTQSVHEYMKLINSDANEFVNFIDTISTNHTYFFRENHHCEFIIRNIRNSDPLNIWSAASSSGEEAYSIAIQLLNEDFNFKIFASDISNTMLSLARRGIYHKDKVRLVPLQILRRYFQRGYNRWKDHVKIKKEVKDHVTFKKHNLISDSSPGLFHIIFCRNVMIYFDEDTKQRVISKLHGSLEHGGYLIIGAAEGLVGLEHGFTYLQPSIYRK
ncbi:MAG: protein-glutamate O-methyltransferase CheR [Thermodesulfobacteriota bacterium]|nr:protein-glutamate O-methyltransferase CheR [Thermodesulfobacteriota bacterium]